MTFNLINIWRNLCLKFGGCQTSNFSKETQKLKQQQKLKLQHNNNSHKNSSTWSLTSLTYEGIFNPSLVVIIILQLFKGDLNSKKTWPNWNIHTYTYLTYIHTQTDSLILSHNLSLPTAFQVRGIKIVKLFREIVKTWKAALCVQ